jgi:hypothetical protein
MTPYQRTHHLTRLPSLLEFFGYVFCFGNLLAGPIIEFRDYQDFIRNQGLWDPRAPRKVPVLGCVLQVRRAWGRRHGGCGRESAIGNPPAPAGCTEPRRGQNREIGAAPSPDTPRRAAQGLRATLTSALSCAFYISLEKTWGFHIFTDPWYLSQSLFMRLCVMQVGAGARPPRPAVAALGGVQGPTAAGAVVGARQGSPVSGDKAWLCWPRDVPGFAWLSTPPSLPHAVQCNF